MTACLRKLHRWVGLVIGLQFALWMGSGLLMALLDHDAVGGHATRTHHAAPAWPVAAVLAPAHVASDAGATLDAVESTWLLDAPMYKLTRKGSSWLVDARTGQRREISARDAAMLAAADYAGDGKPNAPVLLADPGLEARKHKGPLWQVTFTDAANTTLYLSASDGKVLERRNDTWRLFDIAWMLHIMDYSGRADFNHPLVIMAAAGGLWMAVTGLWLLFAVFSVRDFLPSRWQAPVILSVDLGHGEPLTVSARPGATVFDSLAGQGIDLPSTCGGGQQCGLCQVRVCDAAPAPTHSERALILAERLQAGFRLACSLRPDQPMRLGLDGAGMRQAAAVVVAIHDHSPALREIVVRPDTALPFAPGQSLQVAVPTAADEAPLWRCYSPSLPYEAGGEIALLVRLLPGRGPDYLSSLGIGAQLSLRGPVGHLRLVQGAAPKVFIGGGAGMAPLRAMVHALVGMGAMAPITIWYGARDLADAPYAGEFEALAARHTHVDASVVLSTHGASPLHDAARQSLLMREDLHACEFYVCGPPGMLHATVAMLAGLGVDPAKVCFEDFMV